MSSALVEIAGVSKRFASPVSSAARLATMLGAKPVGGVVHAVEEVSLTIVKGEALGLVGESGCGKSTLGRLVAGIESPTRGSVLVDSQPVRIGDHKVTARVQTIFQDPYASLDPRMRIGDALAEGPVVHGLTSKREARSYVAGWLARVGLDPAFADRFPHQFSGGQRQRVAIARALAMQPDILVCDEPVASLDVSIQAQIINLFLQLRRELGLTLLFISHDLGVVRHFCDRAAIMYLGRIVEIGPVAQIYGAPRHPYTRALLDSVPRLVTGDDARTEFRTISGELPSPLNPPSGCAFHTRCPLAFARCREEIPRLLPVGSGLAACHLVEMDVAA